MGREIHVLCGFDDAYAPHCATMMASLFAASRDPGAVRMHLISSLLGAPIRARLDDIAARYGIGKIEWMEVDLSPLRDAPLTLHFTRAAYARILAFSQIAVERVLYLDVDLICLADLAELYASNLNGNIVGAVMDPAGTFGAEAHKAALGVAPNAICFNSGVLAVDTIRWKSARMTGACLKFLAEKKSAIRWADQDVLNGVLQGRWQRLASQWNAQSHFWKPMFRAPMARAMPAELDIIREPRIVHFNDPMKPWHFAYPHPYRETYFQHLAKSGWPHRVCAVTMRGVRDRVVMFG